MYAHLFCFRTPTKFTSDPDDPPTPTLGTIDWFMNEITIFGNNHVFAEDFGISESTLASLTDDKSARKSELSSVQRGLSFTETAVTGVKPSPAPSVTSAASAKPTDSVKSVPSSNVSTSVKSVTAPATTNTSSVKPSVAPSVSTSTTTKPVEIVSSTSDHVPADFMNNANIEVREKKKKSGKKKSNNSNPGKYHPLIK